MSISAVQDITSMMAAGAQSVKAKSNSSITPFPKVLEENLYASKTDKTSEPSSVSSTKTGEASLQAIFQKAAEEYDISYDFLVAIAKAESNFNPKAVSSAGAEGIMQLMPATQKDLGVKDPFDAKENIMAAARLLKAHLKKFDGDYTLAAAAYNAGSGRVQQYGGVPPYTETQNYVKKVEKYRKEGVEVPDRTVKVSEDTDTAVTKFDTGKTATESDLEQVTVAVGTGNEKVTMSYGAYLKYLELGTSGVG